MSAAPLGRRPSTMHASVPLVVACGALLSALTLLQIGGAATTLRRSVATSAASDPTAAATRQAVARFCSAVNVALATGAATMLEAALAPAFVDHAAADRTRAAFITDVLARRRADPDLQFAVAAVLVDGDQALAYVQTASFTAGEAPPTTTIEALRVRDGMIVDRWRAEIGPATVVAPSAAAEWADGIGGGALPPPAPAERWRGDRSGAASATPAATPPRFPRTEK